MTVNLSSTNAGVATVPASVSFGAGATSAAVPVTGVGAGSATITASAAGIPNANAGVTVGLATVNLADDPMSSFNGFWGACSTYGSFSYLKYGPMRLFSQLAQDCQLKVGKVIWVAGHSGPETAEDSRTHFGIYETGVTQLFPEGMTINLFPWEHNEVPVMLAELDSIAAQHRIRIATIAHAGDGNLHPLIVTPPGDEAAHIAAHRAFEEVIDAALALGGTVTGEHGVGLLKRAGMERELDPGSLEMQRAVKRALDPLNVFNPGKLVAVN